MSAAFPRSLARGISVSLFLATLLPGPAWSHDGARDGPGGGVEAGRDAGLDPAFGAWIEATANPAYGEMARRFLGAAGRDVSAYEKSMQRLAAGLSAFLEEQKPTTARDRAAAVGRYLFARENFRADLDLSSLENLYPDRIVERRRGYCLGLTLVVLDLGERLALPLAAGGAPRHTFVRYLDGEQMFNIETTRSGALHDGDWYRRHFGLEIRTLAPRETAAHLLNNHGFVLLGLGERAAAERQFRAALGLAPDLVEATINLGVLQARAGDYGAALSAFEDARRAWPNDFDLGLNRVNALLSVGRTVEAAGALESLLGVGSDLERLERTVATVRSRLDRASEWDRIQRLTTTLNARVSARRGRAAGLRGSYFKDRRLRERVFERVDRDLSFKWSWGSPGSGVPNDDFSVRWQGWLDIPTADRYSWWIVLSDGIRIWIDGHEVLDAWRRSNDNSAEFELDLCAGLHDIRVEYFEAIGEAGIKCFFMAGREEDLLDLSGFLAHPERP